VKKITCPPPAIKAEVQNRIAQSLAAFQAHFAGQGERPPVNAALYKGAFREALLREFNGKCAYCDRELSAQLKGDVEHLRPKGRVKDLNGNYVMRKSNPKVRHPGYWWLAYEWSNLVVVCKECNTRYKGDKFIVEGDYVEEPGPLDESLLVHHHNDRIDPIKHFRINDATGSLVPVTPQGEMTCRLLGLNREVLCEERLDKLDLASYDVNRLTDPHSENYIKERARRRLLQLYQHKIPHSYFCKEYIDQQARQAQANLHSVIASPSQANPDSVAAQP
jgi:hypothetical protein